MKPERESKRLLKITRSQAKMVEFAVPEEFHITIERDPEVLFNLAIGLLGDAAVAICTGKEFSKDDLRFASYFFDNFNASGLGGVDRNYVDLLGSSAFYLSDVPGSAYVLSNRLREKSTDLGASGIGLFIKWILTYLETDIPSFEGSRFASLLETIVQKMSEFFATGKLSSIEENLKTLRTAVYSSGNGRELLFGDVACALVRKRVENSSWRALPKFSDLDQNLWRPSISKLSFAKELWPSQRRLGEAGVYRGKSALVQMPTSAGKTRGVEFLIRSAFLSGRANLALIVAPFRALCSEIQYSLRRQFRGEDFSVDQISDVVQTDYDLNEFLGHKQVVVITPEKLAYVLRQNPELHDHVDLIVFDEAHMFDHPSRGVGYELLLSTLRRHLPERTQKILISAVIKNAEEVNAWLLGSSGTVISGQGLMPTYRSVGFAQWTTELGQLKFVENEDPETDDFFVPRILQQHRLERRKRERKERYFPEKTPTDVATYLGLRLSTRGCVAIYSGRKDTVNKMCRNVVKVYSRKLEIEKPSTSGDADEIAAISKLIEDNLGSCSLSSAAAIGVFPHHGGIPLGIRSCIEFALANKKASLVVCTSTLAQGVNLPIRYLIIAGTRHSADNIKIRDFHNLIGRAGRSGMHTEGVVLFADPRLYESKWTHSDRWKWELVTEMLDPANSEDCSSHLRKIFDPLLGKREKRKRQPRVNLDVFKLIEIYRSDSSVLDSVVEEVLEKFGKDRFEPTSVRRQLEDKMSIVASIESFLLANFGESVTTEEEASMFAAELSIDTLAHFSADDATKEKLYRLFSLIGGLAFRVKESSSDGENFGKTLYGLDICKQLETWVANNYAALAAAASDSELVDCFWPLFESNIKRSVFTGCNMIPELKNVLNSWIQGVSHGEILASLPKEIRFSRSKPTPTTCVELCDGAISFDGSMLVGAVQSILEGNEDAEQVIERLVGFQKRLKYGLRSDEEVAVFEFGFSDRIIAQELAPLVGGKASKRTVRGRLVAQSAAARDVLRGRPSFYLNLLPAS